MKNTFKYSWLAAAIALVAVGCGDDDASDPVPPTPDSGLDSGVIATPDASDDASVIVDTGTPAPTEPPVYAVVSVPATAMGAPVTSYVILTDKLTGELRTENAALEVAGSAIAAGPAGGKRLYVGTNNSGLLTRYDLNAAGTGLTKSGELNFEARQVPNFTSYAANMQFVSANKAYFFALGAAKIVTFDPEAMTLTGEMATPTIVRADPANPGTNYTTNVTGTPLRVGNKLYWFVSWDSRTAGTIKVAAAAAVVAVDTTNDTVNVVLDEGTCGYTRDGVVVGDWIYLATESAGTAVHHLNPANGQAPCLRRFNMNTQQFDAAYKVDLNAIAGAPVGTMIGTPGGKALTFVLDTATAAPMIGAGMGQISNPRVLAVGALWKGALITLGDNPTIEVLNLPLASGSLLPHVLLDGTRVTATFDAMPQLRAVTDNGVVATDRVSARLFGNTASIVELR